jgi:hypothetical protein
MRKAFLPLQLYSLARSSAIRDRAACISRPVRNLDRRLPSLLCADGKTILHGEKCGSGGPKLTVVPRTTMPEDRAFFDHGTHWRPGRHSVTPCTATKAVSPAFGYELQRKNKSRACDGSRNSLEVPADHIGSCWIKRRMAFLGAIPNTPLNERLKLEIFTKPNWRAISVMMPGAQE